MFTWQVLKELSLRIVGPRVPSDGRQFPGCHELPSPRQSSRQRRELEARGLHLAAQSLGCSFALDKLS